MAKNKANGEMTLEIKLCGLSTAHTVQAAQRAGADFIGFVLYPKSPRAVTPEQARALIAAGRADTPGKAQTVALVVDADDAELGTIMDKMAPDWIQAHGAETPERVAAVAALTARPVIKAIAVESPEDLARAKTYEHVAGRLLFDAKPPRASDSPAGSSLPGGNGLCFDWRLLAGHSFTTPWLLAGGLAPDTVGEAVGLTGAPGVDVSSGIEIARGVKSVDKIRAFVAKARNAAAQAVEKLTDHPLTTG